MQVQVYGRRGRRRHVQAPAEGGGIANRRRAVQALRQSGLQAGRVRVPDGNVLLIDDTLDDTGGVGRIEDQVEMSGHQPIRELAPDVLVGRVAQVLDAPMLNRNDAVQTRVVFQDLGGRLGSHAGEGRPRQGFAQAVEQGQLRDQIADAIAQTQQYVRRLDVHQASSWMCDL